MLLAILILSLVNTGLLVCIWWGLTSLLDEYTDETYAEEDESYDWEDEYLK